MSFSLRTTILATGWILAVGTSAAWAQMPSVYYYYPAPGNYAATRGTVYIPAAGYYYVPLYAGQAPASPAPAQAPASPAPAQGFTYSYPSFYYPQGRASRGGGYEANVRGSVYVSGDEEDDPDW